MAQSDRSYRSSRRERTGRGNTEAPSIISSEYASSSYPFSQSYSQYEVNTSPQYAQVACQTPAPSYPQTDYYYPGTAEPDYHASSGPASDPVAYNSYANSIASSQPSVSVSNGWDAQSLYTTPTVATSAPPRYDNNDVDYRINSQPTTTQRYELPCEYQGCGRVYHGDEETEWIRHLEEHLGGIFPSKLRCWFDCPFFLFDANNPAMGGNTRNNFESRMRHIRDHIIHDGCRPRDRIVDGFLVEHLKHQGRIDEHLRREWLKPSRVPSIVSSSRSKGGNNEYRTSSKHHHRSSHGYSMMAEGEVAGPSSSRDKGYEKKSEKKEHKRDSHSKKKSTK